jgi:hypothetical protein
MPSPWIVKEGRLQADEEALDIAMDLDRGKSSN